MLAVCATLLLTAAPAQAVQRKPAHRPAAKAAVQPAGTDAYLAANARQRGVVQTASGLQYRVLAAGAGTAKPGNDDVALVNYVGKLTNGTTFDQSAQPTPMPVAGVVPGFSEALKAMPKGAKYRVWIKPSLGYGDVASGPIPAGSVLVFDIELLDFISAAQFQQLQQQARPAN
ncbi:FKBP-type peptidyl-prolyl cis-trans isomerase [Sphingomonas sp. RB3P16]|uniref:FKBP-type peptidyl-prolyl cis-trans isomerase n=1 Tax=Parasphingomonas frigoris TaxID=3096163 RepID=UPI002FC61BCC